MKKPLLLIALAIGSAAQAASVFEMRNEAGGVIVLTSRPGPCEAGTKQAYATSANASPIFGCWGFMDGRVWVKYPNGNIRVHDPQDFTEKEDGMPVKRSPSVAPSRGM